MNSRFLPVLGLLALVSCEPDKPPATAARAAERAPVPPAAAAPAEPDTTANGTLAAQLQAIRANYQRLNAVRRWDTVVQRELTNSTEGGEATYYLQSGRPAKIVAENYGETFQHRAEFYLRPDGQLAFVFEKATRYNRPFYYDSATAQGVNDPEVFDLKKSTIEETRSYFAQGRLIRQLGPPQGDAAPADKSRLAEQKRLQTDFKDLLRTLNQPQ